MKNLNSIDWEEVYNSLDEKGYAVIPAFLSHEECSNAKDQYTSKNIFRTTIDMQRYRFGKGEYKYYNYPLPDLVLSLRATIYPFLAIVANRWMCQLSKEITFPLTHQEFVDQCAALGQARPTPLLLHYEKGGYNTLHQDLYGDVYFPFQVVFPLSQVGEDFDGGEFVLVEQIPRAQSKAEVIQLNKGDGLVFTTNFRPIKGVNGYYKANMKHGVSPLKNGERYALGIIFHDSI